MKDLRAYMYVCMSKEQCRCKTKADLHKQTLQCIIGDPNSSVQHFRLMCSDKQFCVE